MFFKHFGGKVTREVAPLKKNTFSVLFKSNNFICHRHSDVIQGRESKTLLFHPMLESYTSPKVHFPTKPLQEKTLCIHNR